MRTRHVAALAALGFGVAACSGSPAPLEPNGPGTTDEPARDLIDARAYIENYDQGRYEGGSPAAGSQPTMVSEGDAADSAAQPAPEVAPLPPPEPGFLDDNTFVDTGTSAWTTTADQQLSTFGLDVDTGSFGVARTFLDQGYLPDPDSIRVEEWINSFSYGDQPPPDGALGLSVESAPTPRGEDGTSLVRIGVSTQELTTEERPSANITFVVDVSGSMDIRERLGTVQASLALLANNLRADDTVSIVVYGTEAEVLLPSTPVSDTDAIVAAIDEMVIGGSTNMEAGLDLGYAEARAQYDPESVNVVVLASDGVANVGMTEAGGLTDRIAEAGSDGINLVTVGFGMGNYNDQLMEQLANLGDGFYGYVDSYEEAERLFVDELTPTLAVVANDTKVQVDFDPAVVESYRLIGYENRQLEDDDFTDDSVDAGELGAGHQVSALYEVRPVDGAAPDAVAGTVGLRWAPGSGDDAVQLDADITIDSAEASLQLRMAALVSDTAEVLKGAGPVAERGIGLDELLAEAEELEAQDVDGAQQMVEFLSAALDAESAPERGHSDH